VKITADTNILVRAVVGDDAHQSALAAETMRAATAIAVPIPVLCEFVWVLRRVYGFASPDVAAAVRALLDTAKVLVDRVAAEAGLAMLDAGGDFADGAIACEGRCLGRDTFVSFDKKAVDLLLSQGHAAVLL